LQHVNDHGRWNWLRKKARTSNCPSQGAVCAVSAEPARQDDYRYGSGQFSPELTRRIPVRWPLDVEQNSGDVRVPGDRNGVLKTTDAQRRDALGPQRDNIQVLRIEIPRDD
jgi:hypothetical protein